jgi:hypothetical protein
MNTASTRVRLLIAALFATLLVTLPAAAQEAPPPIPSFEALEAAGATVGERTSSTPPTLKRTGCCSAGPTRCTCKRGPA